jgi:magnesium transporter
MDSMAAIKIFHFTAGGKMNPMASMAEALEVVKSGGYLWVDCFKPARDEFESVAASLNLHPLAVEDCFDDNQVPKMEDYAENTFFIFNAFNYQEGELGLKEIDLFIGEKFLVTVTGYGSDLPEAFAGIHSVIEQNMGTVKAGVSYLMYLLLDRIVDHKFHAIDSMETELAVIEEQVLESPDIFEPGNLVRIRRQLMVLRKSLFHEREILIKICRKDCRYIAEKAIFHFRDIYDHLAKFFELSEAFREMVASHMELYMSVQNNRMARNSNETNAFIKRLTLITTIFMPLTLLAGIGGMSEWTMMTGQSNWKWAYPVFMAGMVLVGFVNYQLLKHIEKRRHREREM